MTAPKGVVVTDQNDVPVMRLLVRNIDSDGVITSAAERVTLSQSRSEISVWGPDDNPVAMIGAAGYAVLNKTAGLSCMGPEFLIVPHPETGEPQRVMNPHIERDPATRSFLAGYCRKVVVGRGPLGDISIHDRTLYVCAYDYYCEDMQNVQRSNPMAVMWGTRETSPAQLLRESVDEINADINEQIQKAEYWHSRDPEKNKLKPWLKRKLITPERLEQMTKKTGRWGFLPIEPVSGMGLWFDVAQPEVRKVLQTYTQIKKWGSRRLESIATRNALRAHPATPEMKIAPEDLLWDDQAQTFFTNKVVHYTKSKKDEDEVRAIVDSYNEGMRAMPDAIDTLTPADVQEDDLTEPDGQATFVQDEDAPHAPPDESSSLRVQITKAMSLVNETEARRIMLKYTEKTPFHELGMIQLRALHSQLNNALDKENR